MTLVETWMAYQLVKIPAADLHIAPILIQTLGERLGIGFAASWTPAIGLVSSVVGLASHAIVRWLRLCSSRARSATEETADSVADG